VRLKCSINTTLIAVLAIFQTINAARIVAVLEITPSDANIELTISEFRHLTDELRTQARETLPKDYTILTRDNIFQLLPQDEAEMERLSESYAPDIGKVIGAEYVTQGQIRKFGNMLTLTVELYESANRNMLGSFVAESQDIVGLLNAIREKSSNMFKKLYPPEEHKQSTETTPIEITTTSSLPAFKLGFTAKAGFANSGVKHGKSGIAYSAGLIMVKNFDFVDFVPELLLSGDAFEINERQVNILKVDIPLTARVVLAKSAGISLGAVVSLPLFSKIEDEVPSDAGKFGLAAIGSLAYLITEDIFVNVSYEKYWTKNFKSVENSNSNRVLCGIGYLF
jgi:hypothetical protein